FRRRIGQRSTRYWRRCPHKRNPNRWRGWGFRCNRARSAGPVYGWPRQGTSMGAAELRVVDTHDGEIEGAIPILLKPGEYQLRLTHWTTYRLFGRAPKLALWFSVLD